MMTDSRAPRAALIALGCVAAVIAPAAALFVVGPAGRAIFGTPVEFGTDFTSPQALRKALLVHALCGAAVFGAMGFLLGRRCGRIRFMGALWAANPATLFVGFAAFRWIAGPDSLWEYTGYPTWGVFSLVGWALMASFLTWGTRTPRQNAMARSATGLMLLAILTRSDASSDADQDRSPHEHAISLVLARQKGDVEKIEQGEKRWTDMKARTWKVIRLFPPGYLDSTKLLQVEYLIDNDLKCRWQVNLRTQEVRGRCGADIPAATQPAFP